MLKVENISKSYDKVLAVDNLSFEVKDGEIFALLGVNGAGKTTTFRCIMGLLDADKGTILLNGKKIDYDQTDNIGFLTEERSLLTKLTVKEQIIYYGVLKGMQEVDILAKLDYWLERFNVKEYLDRPIKELSKGNQQKIQFISAVINEPKLLILDEPFTGLDPINVEMFMSAIRNLKKKGTSIIFSSHRMEHVELFCEKLVVLVRGKSVLEGSISDIKKKYRKKNIFIKADVKVDTLMEIEGVISVEEHGDKTYVASIKDESVVKKVFEYIKTCDNVTEFSVEEPSLNEIFVSIVGESYEA